MRVDNVAQRRHQRQRNLALRDPVISSKHVVENTEFGAGSEENTGSGLATLEKLKSTDANERAWACASLTNIVIHIPMKEFKQLLATGVVSGLIQCVRDPELAVSIEALTALSYFCFQD